MPSTLRQTGVPHHEYVNGYVDTGKRLKSPAAGIRFSAWKVFGIHLHPRVVDTYARILAATYGNAAAQRHDGLFGHPFEPFESERCIPYIDRVCYRLPGEEGLGMHIDMNPFDPYLERSASGGLQKWRPVQSFVCLTDHYGADDGGLQVVPGFHKTIDAYFSGRLSRPPVLSEQSGGGEFFRFKDRAHTSLERKLETVVAPAGSMVLWDRRIPHATTAQLNKRDTQDTPDTREVVYAQFLPDVRLNRRYAEEKQWRELIDGKSDRDWDHTDIVGYSGRVFPRFLL